MEENVNKVPIILGPEKKQEISEIKKEMDLKSKIEFHKRFLMETGLKIGDIVSCSFSVSSGNSKQSYSSLSTSPAELKQNEDGTLYCESLNPIRDSYNQSNGRTGRSYRSAWHYRDVIKKVEITNIK